ncbi:hypothetical protein ILYODFUR_031602 [Ilyodon furcidens]|uniref:Uncharacterized protein n=1 Tax=Ilyodon furcidens TaxID=33524 RepID=A0ABV0VB49_9TELE
MPRWTDFSNNLLLFIKLRRIIRSFPNYLKSIILQRRLFPSEKHLRQLPIFPGVDVPADLAQGQSVKLREMTKNKMAPHLRFAMLRLIEEQDFWNNVRWTDEN